VGPASPFLPQFHDKWNGTDDRLRPRFGSPKQRNILPLFLSADNNVRHIAEDVENQVPPTLTTIIPSALPFQPPLF
jgi:hypothetical protein